MPRGRTFTTREQRVEWLRLRPFLWKLSEQEVCRAMKQAGMFSRISYWQDCHIKDHLADARKSAVIDYQI